MVSALLLIGCLERVTDEPEPLDPRYYAGADNDPGGQGNPNGSGEAPFSGYEGATVRVLGTIESPGEGTIQIDVNVPDAKAPGGVSRVGAIHLPGTGDFEIDVPTDVKALDVQAFQDADGDGPSEQDPYAQVMVDLAAGAPAEPVVLKLVAGARGQPGAGGGAPGSPGGAPHGGPGGGAPGSPGGAPHGGPGGGAPGGGADTLSFPGSGATVTLSGTITATRGLPVILDVFLTDAASPGGRRYLGRRMMASAGPFELTPPRNVGKIELEAYQDLTGDSRSGDDPSARTAAPIEVGSADVRGLTLAIP